jgi:hypothetical protein
MTLTILLPHESTSPTPEQKEREKKRRETSLHGPWQKMEKKEMKLNHKAISDQGICFSIL